MATEIRILKVDSPEQLQAIGQLALTFGTIESLIRSLCASLWRIELEETWQDAMKRTPRSFEGLVRELGFALNRVGKRFGVPAAECEAVLNQVQTLARHRNDIIHGDVEFDEGSGLVIFANRARTRSTAAHEIESLNQELLNWALKFSKQYRKFFEAIA